MRFNVTVDAPSPLLNYEGSGWRPIVAKSDTRISDYLNTTGKTTNHDGDSVSLQFTGTGIWAIGARRFNHGIYSYKLDDASFANGNGTAVPDQFQQQLFGASNLANIAHTLTFANDGTTGSPFGGPFFDIDQITFEFDAGDGSFAPYIIDNSDPSLSYLPSPDAWKLQRTTTSLQSTISTTATSNASVRFSFPGSAVGLFGHVSPTNGNYTCQVDDQNTVTYNAQYNEPRAQQLLCFFQGLGPGNHTLTAMNGPSESQFTVDFATVWSTENLTSTTVQSSEPVPAGRNLGSQITVKQGVVIGVSVMSVILMALFSIFAVMCFRRRRTSSRARYNRRPAPSYLIEDPDSIRSPNPIPISPYISTTPTPVPRPRPSHESESGTETDSSLTSSSFKRHRPAPSMPAKWKANMPGLMVHVSSSRVVTVDQMRNGEALPISNDRMRVKGRAQDGGVRLVVTNGRRESSQSGATRNSLTSVLPPDYGQAVEPVTVGAPPSSYVAGRRL